MTYELLNQGKNRQCRKKAEVGVFPLFLEYDDCDSCSLMSSSCFSMTIFTVQGSLLIKFSNPADVIGT